MNDDSINNTVVKVNDVSKVFKLPHEKSNSIKGALINFWKKDKGFEKLEAIKNVSFEVKKGEFFGIVGRNGGGKSTLLKLLAGIYTPTKGNIEVRGKLTPFIELGVGFNPELTGRENVFLNGSLLGFNRKEMLTMYDDIVEFAELDKFMDQKLKNYSSGMQVRLAFSIAIRARLDILVLDEVLAVGDAEFQQKCYNYFEELRDQKKTVIFVSHDMDAVRRFCTRAIYIKEGKLVSDDKPAKIADIYRDENIEVAQDTKNKNAQDPYNLKTEITSYKQDKLELGFSYHSKDTEEMYIGISIIKDGISIAEINTLPDIILTGNQNFAFTLDTSILNGGVYYITTAIFKVRNKELVSTGKNQCEFTVKRYEPTKGAALRLENKWRYV